MPVIICVLFHFSCPGEGADIHIKVGGYIFQLYPVEQLRKMFFKIAVALFWREHTGRSYFEIFQVTVTIGNDLMQAYGFGIFSEMGLDVLVMNCIQFAVFKCLDIVQACPLTEKAFKQYDRIIFFHKPGGHFAFIAVIITTYHPLLQVPGIMAHLTFKKQEFILFLSGKTQFIPVSASNEPETGCRRFKKEIAFSIAVRLKELPPLSQWPVTTFSYLI